MVVGSRPSNPGTAARKDNERVSAFLTDWHDGCGRCCGILVRVRASTLSLAESRFLDFGFSLCGLVGTSGSLVGYSSDPQHLEGSATSPAAEAGKKESARRHD